MPEFGKVTGAEAVRLLGALGLVGSVEEVYDEEVPQGQIVGAVPRSEPGPCPVSRSRCWCPRGPSRGTVPDVVGQPSAEAFVALGRAELQVGRVVRRETAGAEPGTIVSTTPAGGEQAPKGYPVAVVVAAEPGSVDVPDVVGFTQSSASRIASELGLKLSVRTQIVSPGDRRAGRVISQSPVANSPVGPGATVMVTVGAVPAPTTTSTTTTTPGQGATTTTAPRR